MHLSNSMKQLMAYCYSNENAIHYEYSFDKRDESFTVRFFLTEHNYFAITLKGNDTDCEVREYNVTKSWYHPSTRVTYLNKYFKKYRVDASTYMYLAIVPINVVLEKLSTISASSIKLTNIAEKDKYNAWRGVFRATAKF
jgi:hypothetical protein